MTKFSPSLAWPDRERGHGQAAFSPSVPDMPRNKFKTSI